MKATFPYLQMRAKALMKIHSLDFVADCIQMLTSNKVVVEDGAVFLVINNERRHLA